jgi:hypothetical protein
MFPKFKKLTTDSNENIEMEPPAQSTTYEPWGMHYGSLAAMGGIAFDLSDTPEEYTPFRQLRLSHYGVTSPPNETSKRVAHDN